MTEAAHQQVMAELECDYLNEVCPVGTLVKYWPVSGPYFHNYPPEVKRVTAKFEIRGGMIVGWVDGQSGFVDADHIEPMERYADEKRHYKWIIKFSRP